MAATGSDDSDVAFLLHVPVVVEEVLVVTNQDAEELVAAARASGLARAGLARLGERVAARSSGPTMAKDAFDAVLADLCSDAWPGSTIFDSVYYALADDTGGNASTEELCIALSFFCGGGKSDKLAFIFEALRGEEGEALDAAGLGRLFRTLLLVLYASTNGYNTSDALLAIDGAAAHLADQVRRAVGGGAASFELFGLWYNGGGHVVAPWVELLDLRKWRSTNHGAHEELNPLGRRFEFPLASSAQRRILYTVADVRALLSLVDSTGIGALEPSDISAAILSRAADGFVGPAAFSSAMAALLGACPSACLLLFEDLCAAGAMPAREAAVAFAALGRGNKSDKLSHAFAAFAGGAGRSLDAPSLRAFLAALLRMLLCHSSAAPSRDKAKAALAVAQHLALELFAAGAPGDAVSLDHIAAWYTSGGHEHAAWLELLDLGKWRAAAAPPLAPPSPPPRAAPPKPRGAAGEAAERGFEGFEGGELRVAFGPGAELVLGGAALEAARRVVCDSGLPAYACAEVAGAVAARGAAERSLHDWQEVVYALVPAEALGGRALAGVLSHMRELYGALRGGRGSLPAAEAAAALCVFAGGGKSDKLLACFEAFGASSTAERLPPAQVRLMLQAFLTTLCAFSATKGARRRQMMREDVAAACSAAAAAVGKGGAASLDDLRAWYNSGGSRELQWLELLDLGKWVPAVALALPRNTDANADAGANANANANANVVRDDAPRKANGVPEGARRTAKGAQKGAPLERRVPREGAPPPTAAAAAAAAAAAGGVQGCEVIVGECEVPLSFRMDGEDVLALRGLVVGTGLARTALEAMSAALERHATAGVVEKTAFDAAVRELLPGGGGAAHSTLLHALFYSFDRFGRSAVDARELACGFALLCAGGKSAKLSFAFDLLDVRQQGALSRRGLWRFFRSFLTALSAFSAEAAAGAAPAKLAEAIDSAAVWTASQLFRRPSVDELNMVTFEDLAEWYGDGGHDAAPWLELLDLGKWALQAPGP